MRAVGRPLSYTLAPFGAAEMSPMSGAHAKRSSTPAVAANESSVLFNLRELMHLESERVHAEATAAAEAEQKATLAREAAAQRAREEAEAKLAREREDESRMEAARRAEEARLLREAEEASTRIRLDAERATRLLEQELLLKHERELLILQAAQKPRASRTAYAMTAVGLGALGVAIFVVFNPHAPPATPTLPTSHGNVAATSSPLRPTAEVVHSQVSPVTTPTRHEVPRRNRVARTSRLSRTGPATTPAAAGLESLANDGPIDVIDGLGESTRPRRHR